MARVLFDGLVLNDRFLQNLKTVVAGNKWDAVSFGDNDIDEGFVLGTFETEREAKDYVNEIGEKMIASEAIYDVVDGRITTDDPADIQ